MTHLNFISRTRLVPRSLGACGVALGVAGAALHSTAVFGQTDHVAQRQLAQAYVAAIRSQDPAAVKALWHPATRACDNGDASAFFEQILTHQLRDGAASGSTFEIKSIEPVSAASDGKVLPPSRYYKFPVAPVYVMEVDARSSTKQLVKIAAIITYLAPAGGRWFIDTPCPTPEGVAALRRK